jgi:hypothetical protein
MTMLAMIKATGEVVQAFTKDNSDVIRVTHRGEREITVMDINEVAFDFFIERKDLLIRNNHYEQRLETTRG